uniref:Uncharacterized protein n=1 Tax=Anguilla anguilla TaxID=7936 RepID=A0A0E9PBN8_ANGAN
MQYLDNVSSHLVNLFIYFAND